MPDKPKEWIALRRLADSCLIRGDLNNASRFLNQAVNIAEHTDPGKVAIMANSLAKIWLNLEAFDKAEAVARKSIRYEMEFGDCGQITSSIASYHMMLAQILEKQLRFAEALECVDKALVVFKDYFPENDSFLINIQEYRAYLKQNM